MYFSKAQFVYASQQGVRYILHAYAICSIKLLFIYVFISALNQLYCGIAYKIILFLLLGKQNVITYQPMYLNQNRSNIVSLFLYNHIGSILCVFCNEMFVINSVRIYSSIFVQQLSKYEGIKVAIWFLIILQKNFSNYFSLGYTIYIYITFLYKYAEITLMYLSNL